LIRREVCGYIPEEAFNCGELATGGRYRKLELGYRDGACGGFDELSVEIVTVMNPSSIDYTLRCPRMGYKYRDNLLAG
jgi:hypothetical protein